MDHPMLNRSAVAGFALVLIGGLTALYFLVIKDSPAAKSEPPAVATTGSGEAALPTGQGPSLPSAQTGPLGPRLPQQHKSTEAERDTTGMVMTDHRNPGGGSNVMIAEGSNTADKRKLDPGLVRSIHRNAEAIMVGCASKVAADDRGPHPRIGASLKVVIEDGNLRVTEVTPKIKDLGGPEIEAVKTCVQEVMMNFTAPTPDEADLDSYELHYQYVVR